MGLWIQILLKRRGDFARGGIKVCVTNRTSFVRRRTRAWDQEPIESLRQGSIPQRPSVCIRKDGSLIANS